jgi:hypothetical protein
MWYADIFSLGVNDTLTEYLNRLTQQGWDVRFVMANGLDRWTVVCWRDA